MSRLMRCFQRRSGSRSIAELINGIRPTYVSFHENQRRIGAHSTPRKSVKTKLAFAQLHTPKCPLHR